MAVDGINVPFLNKTTVNNSAVAGQQFSNAAQIFTGAGDVNLFGVPTTSGALFVISGSGSERNRVVVNSVFDLPPPSSQNIVLSANTVYQFAGFINIGNNFLTLNENTTLMGNSYRSDGITSSYNGYVINSNSFNNVVKQLTIVTPSGLTFNILGNNTARFLLQETQISGCSGLGLISGINALAINDNRITDNLNGLDIYGPSDYIRMFNNRVTVNSSIVNHTGFAIRSGVGNINTFQISSNTLHLNGANNVPFFINSGITTTGLLVNNIVGNATGNATIGGGLNKADPSWLFNNNIRMLNSVHCGEIFLSGNVTFTSISAVNTYTQIAGISQTGTIMERFVSPTSGQLQYVGQNPIDALATCFGTFQSQNAGKTISVVFRKNGIVLPYPSADSVPDNKLTSFTIASTLRLVSGDTVDLYCINKTDNNNILVGSYVFNIRAMNL
jgi:hypothetical protein